MVEALDFQPQATSCVARDDRDGCSRYRAAKMSPIGDELGWYRDFTSPLCAGGGVFLCVFKHEYMNFIFIWR